MFPNTWSRTWHPTLRCLNRTLRRIPGPILPKMRPLPRRKPPKRPGLPQQNPHRVGPTGDPTPPQPRHSVHLLPVDPSLRARVDSPTFTLWAKPSLDGSRHLPRVLHPSRLACPTPRLKRLGRISACPNPRPLRSSQHPNRAQLLRVPRPPRPLHPIRSSPLNRLRITRISWDN